LELHGSRQKVTFGIIRARLIKSINLRVRNGEFSERGLARVVGVSQPQIHNVLKGTRKLAPELADKLLAKLEINVLDLLAPAELTEHLAYLETALSFSSGPYVPELHRTEVAPAAGKKSPGRETSRAVINRRNAC
jgi:predicted XRE-type DNA-binding protein